MAEEGSTRTTYEEAKCCPKCGNPGEVRSIQPAPNLPRGTVVHAIYCVHELCTWYDTVWYVQVNPDGSIPPPQNHRGKKKVYEGFEGHDELAKHIVESVRRQREAETREGGAEIRNPNG